LRFQQKFSNVVTGVGKTFAVFIAQSVAMRQTLIDLANPITFVVKQFSKLNKILTPTINNVYEFFGKSKVGTAISDAVAKAEESLRKPAKTVTQTNQKIVANTLAMQAELTQITAQGLLDRYELEGGSQGTGAFDISKYQNQNSAHY
jgi:hypothetical protein